MHDLNLCTRNASTEFDEDSICKTTLNLLVGLDRKLHLQSPRDFLLLFMSSYKAHHLTSNILPDLHTLAGSWLERLCAEAANDPPSSNFHQTHTSAAFCVSVCVCVRTCVCVYSEPPPRSRL